MYLHQIEMRHRRTDVGDGNFRIFVDGSQRVDSRYQEQPPPGFDHSAVSFALDYCLQDVPCSVCRLRRATAVATAVFGSDSHESEQLDLCDTHVEHLMNQARLRGLNLEDKRND